MKIYFVITLLLVAFSGSSQDSLSMTKMASFPNPSGFISGEMNDVWGYEHNGKEYAVAGSWKTIDIYDVTNCGNPILEERIIDGDNVTWRDFKEYGDYIYAVCDGRDIHCKRGLIVINKNDYTWTNSDTAFRAAHNIFLEGGRLYVVGTRNSYSDGVIIYDVETDPENPVVIAKHHLAGGYIHDIYVENDIAYASSGYDGMYIFDFSDVLNPVFIGSNGLTEQYNHSSWKHPEADVVYVAEEVGSNLLMQVLDISDQANPVITNYFNAPLEDASNFIPHNPYVHEELLYVSHYNDGIQIFDVSDPNDPVRVAYYDTYPQNNGNGYNGYNGAWGVYPFHPSGCILATDINNGFFTLKIQKYGIGSSVTEGYLYLKEAGSGIILTSITGNSYKVTVSDAGAITTLPLIMPPNSSAMKLERSQLVTGDGTGVIMTSSGGNTFKVSYNGSGISVVPSGSLSGLDLSTLETGDIHIARKNGGVIFYNGTTCGKSFIDASGSFMVSPYTCPQE